MVAGQVNFRGGLPRSASNVLEPTLHPALQHYLAHWIKADNYWSYHMIKVQVANYIG